MSERSELTVSTESVPATAPTVVVHVLGALNRGGAETVALDLCRKIPTEQVRQVFVLIGGQEGRLAPQFRAAGADVLQCPLSPVATFVPRLRSTFRRVRPDVVVSHVSLVSGLVLAVAASASVPGRVARMHSAGDGHGDNLRRRVQRGVLRAMLRRSATAVLAVSPAVLDFAIPADRDARHEVLGNGVDIERFRPDPERVDGPVHHPVLLHVGRAAPEKNRAFLLPVLTHLKEVAPQARLVLVGPGGDTDLPTPGQGSLRDPGVELIGERDDVEVVLAEADVLMLPSVWEGLPGVILEALASGIPVLATDLPTLRELSDHVVGISLLPLEAGPEAWAQRAFELAQLPSQARREMATSVRESPFTLDASAERWCSLWRTRT